ncbi:YbgA family protein [Aliidiomarina iranensis]|uniref:YbgA family protein n=1 Tax=Aliidiomarina iranensis TaxID=1434071 RepID=UPI001F5476E0|nr:DUF523 and DUF1722 domain-containing protein [Aliidiomarina iranensis]
MGVSACLLGHKVRYDGGHKGYSFCQNELSRYAEYLPLCPEVGIGLSVPRPTIRLTGDIESPRAIVTDTGDDLTAKLAAFADMHVGKLSQLSGYILCAKSPSCGTEGVRLYKANSEENAREGIGIFAARLRTLFPALPIAEDRNLDDPVMRENFVLRLFVYSEWRAITAAIRANERATGNDAEPTRDGLRSFHSRHKYLLFAHDDRLHEQLAHELQKISEFTDEFLDSYILKIMLALAEPATREGHTRVLLKLQGFFKQRINSKDRLELAQLISQYYHGEVSLAAPVTLMNDYLGRYPDQYLASQSYFHPYPGDLNLRCDI